jgi:surface antigen
MTPKRLTSLVAPASRTKRLLVNSSAALLVAILPVIFPVASSPSLAQSAEFCQCVGYVKNRFGLQGAVGNAKDMIYSLPNLGFRQVSSPQVGAVVVMQPSFSGADPTYGHVGVVEAVRSSGSEVRIDVRGANQWGTPFTEYGCNNVTVIGFGTPVNGRSDVSFWVRDGGSGNPSDIHLVSPPFSGQAAPSGVNIRSAPSLSAAIVGRLEPNQSVSFDAWTYSDVVTDIWLGTPDARWFRLSDGRGWIASAVINGNPPNSSPMP